MENIYVALMYSRGPVGISHHEQIWPSLYNEILERRRTCSILDQN